MSRLNLSTDRRDRLAFWALAGLALVVAHDAIFLVQIGPGEALVATLRSAGHGYWAIAGAGLVLVASLAGAWTWVRMRRLGARARSLGAAAAGDGPRLAWRVAATWARLAAVVAIGFGVQENVEHLIAHGHAPGLGALIGPEYPLAIPVIGLISAVAAVLVALVVNRRDALELAIDAALRRLLRPGRRAIRPPARVRTAITSILAGEGAGRAPPALVVTTS